MFALQLACGMLVACLGCGQIAQQFAGIGILGALGRCQIKMLGPALHRFGLGADLLYPQIFHQPHRAAGVIACHMFAPDQWDHLAKAALVQGNQALAVAIFLGGHTIKHLGSVGELGAQPCGIAAVDARVILF